MVERRCNEDYLLIISYIPGSKVFKIQSIKECENTEYSDGSYCERKIEEIFCHNEDNIVYIRGKIEFGSKRLYDIQFGNVNYFSFPV